MARTQQLSYTVYTYSTDFSVINIPDSLSIVYIMLKKFKNLDFAFGSHNHC